MTYVQAIVLGVIQGVTELFPISSLGHSVILPALLGWNDLVAAQSANESFFLAFLVGLHVATALALLVSFRDEWRRIVLGVLRSVRRRKVETPDERLGWLLILATIPVGLAGLVLEHSLRVLFATPLLASVFLVVNGVILFVGDWARRRAESRAQAQAREARERQAVEAISHLLGQPEAQVLAPPASERSTSRRLDALAPLEAAVIGTAQAAALLPGISRSGITMVAGLLRGLDHEDAARFSFLLATPVILAAGLYKLPDLLGHNGDGVRGQVLAGSIAAAIAAYLSVRFLTRYFRTRSLFPFAVYSVAVGLLCVVRFA
jgi:undecaprenyl-diphosphatase